MAEQVQVQRPLRLSNVAKKVLHKRTTNVLKRSLLTQRRKKEQASVSNYTLDKHFVEYNQDFYPKIALIKGLDVKIRVGNPDLNRRKKKQAGKKKRKKSLLIDAAVCFASVVAVLSYFIFPNVSIAKYYCITFRIVANHQVNILNNLQVLVKVDLFSFFPIALLINYSILIF